VTWVEIFCRLLAAVVCGGLATWVGIVDIPDSPAAMDDPPDPYWPY